jgi:hypothetical protein
MKGLKDVKLQVCNLEPDRQLRCVIALSACPFVSSYEY